MLTTLSNWIGQLDEHLTVGQLRILIYVADHPGRSLVNIADNLDMEYSLVQYSVQRMTLKGKPNHKTSAYNLLAVNRRETGDKRYYEVRLNQRGLLVVRKLREVINEKMSTLRLER